MINGLNHWSKKIKVANCNLHLRPKRKKKKDASSQWPVTAVLMSKDRHYIYPEGRCTEPKIRETIRLISDIKKERKTVYVVKVERLRGMQSLRSKSSVCSGAFSRGITHVHFSKSTLTHLQKCFHASDLITFLIFYTQKQEIWPKIDWSSPTLDSWASPLAWDTPNTNVIRNFWQQI